MWLREQLLGCLSKLLDLQLNGCSFFWVTNTGGREGGQEGGRKGGQEDRGGREQGIDKREGRRERERGIDLLLTCHA